MGIIDISALKNRLTQTEFEIAVKKLIEDLFEDSQDFYVIEERRKYKASESEYIWKQNKGLKPHMCEVYYKGEFVTDVSSFMQPEEAARIIVDKVKYIKENIKSDEQKDDNKS